jgi:hypothetical protein
MTSGEVEYVVFQVDGKMYVTVGSDHSDREIEKVGVPIAKQAWPNIVASQAWEYDELEDHWDQIQIRSWLHQDGDWHLYQEGCLGMLWTPRNLLDRWQDLSKVDAGEILLFSGTIATIGGLRYGSGFRFELADETMGRSILGEYRLEVLPPPIE